MQDVIVLFKTFLSFLLHLQICLFMWTNAYMSIILSSSFLLNMYCMLHSYWMLNYKAVSIFNISIFQCNAWLCISHYIKRNCCDNDVCVCAHVSNWWSKFSQFSYISVNSVLKSNIVCKKKNCYVLIDFIKWISCLCFKTK